MKQRPLLFYYWTSPIIGANATIVCGVTFGRCSFIGAGAVITKDIPDYALVVGNPARQIGWACECGERLVRKSDVGPARNALATPGIARLSRGGRACEAGGGQRADVRGHRTDFEILEYILCGKSYQKCETGIQEMSLTANYEPEC